MSDKRMPSHHGYEEKKSGIYPNDTMRLLMERASCRNFKDQKIPGEVLNLILDAGVHAPTGGNLQPYSVIKIESSETRGKLAEMCMQNFIAQAPVNLLFCIDWHRLERWAKLEIAPFTATSSFRHFWISFQDTIISAQNICTAADAMGLGSVYIGTIMDLMPEIRDLCALPKGVLPVVLLCLGYPKSELMVRRKLGREVVVHDEKYREIDELELKSVFDKKYHHVKIEMTDERLERIKEVCEKVHGAAFAEKCIEDIKKKVYINAAQRYFGLHYDADLMPDSNEEFLTWMKEFGFGWFEKYKPAQSPD
jgi:FMN reductase [NAD(P)H]